MPGYREHLVIYEAIAGGDAAAAVARMRAHILRSARSFLNHVFGTGLEEGDYVD
jgi:DNA-binding GntR family transcriptional regulator